MTRTVLVPVEGSPLSKKALDIALTDYPDADIVVLHVMDPIVSRQFPSLRNGTHD